MLPSDSGAGGNVEDFFLDDSEKPAPSEPGDQTAQQGKPKADSDKTQFTLSSTAEATAYTTHRSFGQRISEYFSRVAGKFTALSLLQKLLATLLPVGLLAILLTTFLLLAPAKKTPIPQTELQQLPAIPEVVVGPQSADTPLLLTTEHPTEPAAITSDKLRHPAPTTTEPHQERTKWPFPAFLIPTDIPSAGKGIIFVRLNLTLIANHSPTATMPPEKNIIVRELIYQFYKNQSPEELQRFTLARSDMSRQLLAWLQEQWPGNPVTYIQIDSYSLS